MFLANLFSLAGCIIIFQFQQKGEDVREKQKMILQEVNSALTSSTRASSSRNKKADPRILKWQVDDTHQKLMETAK